MLPPTNLTRTDVLAANLTTPADKLLLALCVRRGTMTPEAAEWLTPHQAHKGGVTNLASNYSHGGQPLTIHATHTAQPQCSALGTTNTPSQNDIGAR